jgi:hypothetical protein
LSLPLEGPVDEEVKGRIKWMSSKKKKGEKEKESEAVLMCTGDE